MPGTPEGSSAALHPTLHLQLLGPPTWRRPDHGAQPLAARDAALLAVLALDGAQTRERMGAWLWPQASPRQVGDSLRQRLFQLRRSTGHTVVQSGPLLQLAAGVTVDVLAEPLLDEGALLAGCDLGALEALQDWLQTARERVLTRQTQAWAAQAAQCETRGELTHAASLCERIVALRPATEGAWRRLMRLHWLQGDRAAAINSFERFEQQVCRELGLRPSAETLTLLETVERADPQPPAEDDTRVLLPAALLRPPRLVGRDRTLAAARAAWAAGRPVLLLADGGLGKSRLLEALLVSPGLTTRARPGDAEQPYSTLSAWLSQALDRFAPALPGAVRGELARLLPALGPPSPAAADQRRLWQAVEAAVAGCMAQGLRSWALDDLHWADPASLELLRWLLGSESLQGLHGAFAARPPSGGDPALPHRRTADVAAALGDTQRLERLWLEPLTPREVGDLLHSLALPAWSSLSEARLQSLYRHTGGQPFLLLETLKSLVLSGASAHGGNGGDADADADVAGAPLPVPPAVDALIGQRLAGLPPTATALLQLLSVAGGPLRLAVAARAMQQPLPALAQAWSVLAAAQLVHSGAGQVHELAHDLVRECVLRALPDAARQVWHLALARAMTDEPGVEPAVAASHWQAAQHWPQAALAWRAAAAAASRAGRLLEWEALLLQAAAAHREAGEAEAALDDRIDALTARSLRAGPAAAADGLQALLAEGHHGEARARLLMLQGTLAFNQLRFHEVMQLAQAALAQAAEGTRTQQQARLLLGRAAAMSGQHEQAMASLREACAAAQTLAQPERQLEALGALAHALHGARQRAEAVACQRQALQVARQQSGRFQQAECAANLAVLLLLGGEVEAVLPAAEEALAGFGTMDIHDAPSAVMAVLMRARVWAHQGRLASAVQTLQPLAQPGTAGIAGAMARASLAQMLLWLGRPRKALAVLDPEDATTPLNLRVHMALVRAAAGAAGAVPALHALGQAHPSLREDGVVYRDWSRWDPPEQAAPQLDKLAAAELAAGAPATARSLRVRAVACRMDLDARRAADEALALQQELEALPPTQSGLHAGSHPAEAWHTLAAALRAVDAERAARATARAAAWEAAVEWPPGKRAPGEQMARRRRS